MAGLLQHHSNYIHNTHIVISLLIEMLDCISKNPLGKIDNMKTKGWPKLWFKIECWFRREFHSAGVNNELRGLESQKHAEPKEWKGGKILVDYTIGLSQC